MMLVGKAPGGPEIHWDRVETQGCAVVSPRGELDAGVYRRFIDDLVKFAVDEPRAVIVVLDDLVIASEPLYTAFTSAWIRVGDWPGVPILLVMHDDDRFARLRASAVRRFVPVYPSLSQALATVGTPPARRRVSVELPSAADSAQRARRVVEQVCERWELPDIRGDALLIVTELVENAFLHSRADADLELRLEMREDLFTVAVADADPREAVLREPTPGSPRLYGLHVVARLARTWGCAPRRPVGKVVWAVLPTSRRLSH
nr:ATP-binding protein [Nocardia inohanensis]